MSYFEMIQARRLSRTLLMVLGSIPLMFGFQNCSGTGFATAKQLSSLSPTNGNSSSPSTSSGSSGNGSIHPPTTVLNCQSLAQSNPTTLGSGSYTSLAATAWELSPTYPT